MHLAAAFLYFSSNRNDRSEFTQRWSRKLLAILGVRLDAAAVRVAPGTLVVANHVSWLDVFVLSAICPATFVAKSEIRAWPLIGWLLARHDTLFVQRRIGRHLLHLNETIGARLAAGEIVGFFPEGTTTGGADLLPFRPALFEPAVRGAHPARPFVLAYRDASGRRCEEAAFVKQQNLWQSLLAIISLPGIVASVGTCPPIPTQGLTRRDAARRAQAAVQARLCGGSNLPERQKPAPTPAGLAGSASAPGTAPSSAAPIWDSRAAVSRA